MKSARSYTQTARRDATARTRTAILDAGLRLSREQLSVQIALADIAERAGVSVQTVLRHFGSRDALFDELQRYGSELIAAQRSAPVGDLEADVRVLVDHYELWGDASAHFTAQERTDERIASIVRSGRAMHREWVRTLLGPLVARLDEAVIDELVVVTDVGTWKLLRRDRGLSRSVTEQRMLNLARAVIAHAAHRPPPPD